MNPIRASVLAILLATASILLSACGQGADPASQAAVSGDEVRVVDNAFESVHLEVPAGQPVTWVWEGSADHNVVGDGFDSGVQKEGTFTYEFADPGTYDYECTLHPGMKGRITVIE